MTDEKKVPGLLKDPWRNASSMAPAAALTAPVEPVVTSTQEIEEDLQAEKFATIELKGYGGITVEGTNEIPVAAVRLLEFCVDHKKEIESIFTDYGVVIAKMEVRKMPAIKFYIQRSDGWLIAIPGAPTRDAGCFQLIQALMRVQANALLKKKLESYKIRPYKV